MIRTLNEAAQAGEPLIDIVVEFKEGVDYPLAMATMNSLGPDLALHTIHWYGSAKLRIGSVTAEGALRLFNARFRRIPLPTSDLFCWSSTQISQWPEEVAAFVQSIGITQPGADDEGQPYVPLFDR